MNFVLSKVLWILLQPSSALLLVTATGLVLAWTRKRRRSGLRMATAGLAISALVGFLPVGTTALLPLEQRFPRLEVEAGDPSFAGIIVLGGGEDGRITHARGQLHLNEAGERITEGARLALMLKTARVAFTGGAAYTILGDVTGAPAVGAYWQALGIAADRIVLEDRSRTTYENALLLKDIMKPRPGERFLLVTSAAHMPRSMGVFRRAGLDVVAYPVDYRTTGALDPTEISISLPGGLKRLDDAAKEWIGLLAYWAMGRTSALFPGP